MSETDYNKEKRKQVFADVEQIVKNLPIKFTYCLVRDGVKVNDKDFADSEYSEFLEFYKNNPNSAPVLTLDVTHNNTAFLDQEIFVTDRREETKNLLRERLIGRIANAHLDPR